MKANGRIRFLAVLILLTMTLALSGCGTMLNLAYVPDLSIDSLPSLIYASKLSPASFSGASIEEDYATTDLVEDAYWNETDPDWLAEYGADQGVVIHIPRILLPGADAERVNREIMEIYGNDPRLSYSGCKSLRYSSWINGDVLSLLIHEQISFHYRVRENAYNFRISDGKELSRAEFLKEIGVSEEQYTQKLCEAVMTCFLDGAAEEGFADRMDVLYNWEEFTRLLSDSVLRDSMPYLNGQGHLMVSVKISSLADDAYRERSLDLDDYTLTPYYEEALAHLPPSEELEGSLTEALDNLMLRIGYDSLTDSDQKRCRGMLFSFGDKNAVLLVYPGADDFGRKAVRYSLWVEMEDGSIQHFFDWLTTNLVEDDSISLYITSSGGSYYFILSTSRGRETEGKGIVNTALDQKYLIGCPIREVGNRSAHTVFAWDDEGKIYLDEDNCTYSMDGEEMDSKTYSRAWNQFIAGSKLVYLYPALDQPGNPPCGYTFDLLRDQLEEADASSQAKRAQRDKLNEMDLEPDGPLTYPLSERDCYIICKNLCGMERLAEAEVNGPYGEGDEAFYEFLWTMQIQPPPAPPAVTNYVYIYINTGEIWSGSVANRYLVYRAEDYYF